MGLVHAEIELINGRDMDDFEEGRVTENEVRRMVVRMNVDSGAIMLSINENIQHQLGLRTREMRPCQLADGSYVDLPVVWPVMVRFGNRKSVTGALVLPNNTEPLLGAIPMEEMDLLVDPARGRLIPNPEHPNEPVMALR